MEGTGQCGRWWTTLKVVKIKLSKEIRTVELQRESGYNTELTGHTDGQSRHQSLQKFGNVGCFTLEHESAAMNESSSFDPLV